MRAIIFDMDGLLVNSESVWHEAENAMLAARGRQYSDGMRAQVVGLRMDEMFPKLKELLDLPDSVEAMYADLVGRMMRMIPSHVKPQPGASDLLAYVVERDIPRAIASSSPIEVIDAIVQNAGWSDIFTVRCSADDDAKGKPAPDVYLRAARLLYTAPSHCLALEDSPNGARAAAAAGMVCYAVPDLAHTSPKAFDGITDHVFENLYAVLDDLKGILG